MSAKVSVDRELMQASLNTLNITFKLLHFRRNFCNITANIEKWTLCDCVILSFQAYTIGESKRKYVSCPPYNLSVDKFFELFIL